MSLLGWVLESGRMFEGYLWLKRRWVKSLAFPLTVPYPIHSDVRAQAHRFAGETPFWQEQAGR
jgi:hypothetical protein